jgi:hypothetical protein
MLAAGEDVYSGEFLGLRPCIWFLCFASLIGDKTTAPDNWTLTRQLYWNCYRSCCMCRIYLQRQIGLSIMCINIRVFSIGDEAILNLVLNAYGKTHEFSTFNSCFKCTAFWPLTGVYIVKSNIKHRAINDDTYGKFCFLIPCSETKTLHHSTKSLHIYLCWQDHKVIIR